MTLVQDLELLRTSQKSCEEHLKTYLKRIEAKNKTYNIIIDLHAEEALNKAKELDLKLKKKEKIGNFFGAIVLVKANISVKGMEISASSETLKGYKGSFDADVISYLKKEDAIILGMLNQDEFGSGSSGEHSAFGPCINPRAPQRVPGGSSSGPAAALAANFCDFALGTDTGGSTRTPASHCGVVGIKPSYGRVSRYGVLDLSMSLDQIGPLSKSVEDAQYIMELLSKESKNDPSSQELGSFQKASKEKKKHNIGIVKGFKERIKNPQILDSYTKLISQFEKEGHNLIEIEIPHSNLGIQAYYPIVYTEVFSATRRYDALKYGKEIDKVGGEEIRRRIEGGREISQSEYAGAYYKKALKVKELLRKEFTEAFKKVDFIFMPVTPSLPHKKGENISPEEMYAYDVFTVLANLAGLCAGVVPHEFVKEGKEDIPLGFQCVAAPFKEKNLFEGLFLLEKHSEFKAS